MKKIKKKKKRKNEKKKKMEKKWKKCIYCSDADVIQVTPLLIGSILTIWFANGPEIATSDRFNFQWYDCLFYKTFQSSFRLNKFIFYPFRSGHARTPPVHGKPYGWRLNDYSARSIHCGVTTYTRKTTNWYFKMFDFKRRDFLKSTGKNSTGEKSTVEKIRWKQVQEKIEKTKYGKKYGKLVRKKVRDKQYGGGGSKGKKYGKKVCEKSTVKKVRENK